MTVKDGTTSIDDNAFEGCYSLTHLSGFGGDHEELFYTLTNLETLTLTKMPHNHNVSDYFGSYGFNIPLTLKNVVLKKGCSISSANAFDYLTGINIYVEDAKENVLWDEKYPGWNNGNKVYYGGEWVRAVFTDTEGNVISDDLYTTTQVIRQPYIKLFDDGRYSEVLLGWDLDGDGDADSVPATSSKHISARAVIKTKLNYYSVNFYDLDGKTVLYSYSLPYGATIALPAEPVKRGYTFLGWQGYTDGMEVKSNLSIYSKWKHNGDGHNYVKSVVLPTCEGTGYDLFTCDICGEFYKENVVSAHGHDFEDWITDKAPTCEETGVRHRVCSVCGATDDRGTQTDIIAALGHDYVGVVTKQPSCTELGEKTYTCALCGDVIKEALPTTEHNYVKKVVSKTWLQYLIEHLLNIFFGYEGSNGYYFECTECRHVQTREEAMFSTSVKSDCSHVLGDWQDVKVAPCDQQGVRGRFCSKCGNLVEACTVDAIGHDPVHHDGQGADCENKGWYAYDTCSRCDYTTYSEIPALGHDEQDHSAQAPTCTAIGWNAYVTCSRCDYTTYSELKALGHNSDGSIAHEDAKCTETGVVGGKYCTRCNDGKKAAEAVIPALGHDEQDHSEQAPTCTAIGWNAYVTCSRCDYTTYSEISALGHDPVHHDGQAADCENKGWEAYDTCSRCDYTSFKEIPALGHKEGTAVKENYIPATCLNGGTYNSVVYCTACGDKLSSTPKTEEALGHDPVHHDGQAADCENKGWYAYDTCSRCDYTSFKEIPALGHDEGTAVIENHIPATCLNGGTYNSVVYCTVCGDKLSSMPKTEDALGHKEGTAVKENYIPATCLNGGTYNSVVYCTVCGDKLSSTPKTEEALGHDPVHHDGQAADCENNGWEAYDTCSRCDYTTYSEIPALGHDEQDHSAQAPTCTAIGWNAYVTCSRCDYTTYSELKALGHNSDGSIAHEDAKCTETGVVGGKYCTRCNDGKTTAEAVIPVLGHDEQDHSAQAPTCTAIGWNAYVTCSRCDYTTYSELKALGHNSDGSIAHEDAKCTETGVVGGKYCTRCNDGKTTAETVIPALGHDEQDYSAQAPTCTAIGWNAYVTCSRCDYTTYSELKALGHNSDGSIAHKDAKCTETGVVGGKYCTRCNDGKTAAEVVIPALGHDEQDHSAQAPTCTAIGWEAYDTCSRCDYTTYSEISALEHDPIHHDGQAADCENNGWEAYDTCSRCDYTTYFEIPALGHDYVSVDVTEPTCTTDGLISKKQCVNCGQEVDVEEVIPSHGHDWSDWVVVKEASSTEKGLKERVCSRCEFKETVDIPVVKKEDSSGGGCAGCGSSNMAELFSTALLSLAALFFKRH